MDDEDDFRFSVVDVYDIAADIGKEFEKIIEVYGSDALTSLMPRVITALEQLERLAERQETSGAVIDELRNAIASLEHQKLGLAEHRQKFARDLEDIERDMREEKQELSAKVSQLLDENRKLSTSLARSTDTTPCITDDESSLEPEVSRNMVTRLQDALESQRDQLHQLQQQYQLQMAENDQLSGQVERLTQSGKDLRRRARQSTQQIRQLVEERAELHVTLQEQQRTLDQLQQRLGLAAKENYDLATASIDTSDMSGKLVYDRNDPNRPRFTLTELKDILYQRNELKARLSDLEDELNMYRPSNASAAATKQQGGSHIICPPDEAQGPPLVDLDKLFLQEQLAGTSRQNEEPPPVSDDLEDPPVQGPMPYEPDDAPWKRRQKESGIRKFFARMKQLSTAVMPTDAVVMGTSPALHTFHRSSLPLQHHSTPASTYSSPQSSMSGCSPASLWSLPSQLREADGVALAQKLHLDASDPNSNISPRTDDSGFGSSLGLPFRIASKKSSRKLPSAGSSAFDKFRSRFLLSSNPDSNSSRNHDSSISGQRDSSSSGDVVSSTKARSDSIESAESSTMSPSAFGNLVFKDSEDSHSLAAEGSYSPRKECRESAKIRTLVGYDRITEGEAAET
ncbi:RILP-like protein homolog isoform X1 [Hyalella azteca]|uniref:RILP-like protein homolog isoform X1 n=1 Tax=Hyalella azteca TaxID=294128 RepID=A0A979FPL2_HYAAZ|nr:RILP-like protein homolog isoform X1 [Hyalella azteca]